LSNLNEFLLESDIPSLIKFLSEENLSLNNLEEEEKEKSAQKNKNRNIYNSDKKNNNNKSKLNLILEILVNLFDIKM
jgi:hypothetical protein